MRFVSIVVILLCYYARFKLLRYCARFILLFAVLGFAISVTVLTGCATTATPKLALSALEARHNEALVAQLQHWDFSGKVFATDGSSGNSALIFWHNSGSDKYEIKIAAPIGGDYVILSKLAPHHYTLVAADGTKLIAASAEELMEQRLGWHLPLAGFNTWVKGVALPNGKYKVERDAANHTIASLEQDNWLIKYGAYTSIAVGVESKLLYLPTKLEFVRDNIKIKLLLKTWSVMGLQ